MTQTEQACPETTESLVSRLEGAEAGSVALNGAVHRALFPSDLLMTDPGSAGPVKRDAVRQPLFDLDHVPDDVVADCINAPPYTTSIDAALSLAGRVLPGFRPMVEQTHDGTGWAMVKPRHDVASTMIEAATPALALCAAILKAKGTDQ